MLRHILIVACTGGTIGARAKGEKEAHIPVIRRGDRSNAEMQEYGRTYWQKSSPQRIVEKVRAQRLFVMTNSGSKADRDYLREHGNASFLSSDVFPEWQAAFFEIA
jgi:hypothetical protein